MNIDREVIAACLAIFIFGFIWLELRAHADKEERDD